MEECPIPKMKIEISNLQNRHRPKHREIKELTGRIMQKARRIDPGRTWDEISIVLTDDPGITGLNAEHLEKNEATDVLSFCYPPIPGERNCHTGEIIVNVQRAVEEGVRRKNASPSRELALYIAHGCDHLYGQDDADEKDRKRMRRRELKWLSDIEEADHGLVQEILE